ncbi:glycerol-3-phosphate dehydrogenase [Kaistia algarum]|uniref:glycerol-3-phosphate dehydrogenase n=1 Tax=Kaistia algarum TaxID=2083279 RepID=UPI000CE796D8|nr:glycerol-3-phosphate dehydrogenase [Kaistia algarum]MCX5514744.1 hypothetical protein [Kaistia algarum]PPE78835.1 glycerol-3-phosphate dehydrogenase [Kaistia algarum]
MAEIVILGAGVMGSAMTLPAANHGASVTLVGTHLDTEIIRSVAGNGWHPRLGITLPEAVKARDWTDLGDALAKTPDLIILGVSSAGVGWAIDRLVATLSGPTPILMITKGLATDGTTIEVLPAQVQRELHRRSGFAVPVMAVGGPCIAGELAAQRDTSVIVTGEDLSEVGRALGLLRSPYYHASVTDDIIGVEVCAAFKNFYAISVGSVGGRLERDGKAPNAALMHNLSASTFTQALKEMRELVVALGGDPATVGGLAGAGDLYVTCQAGRNGRMGRLLGLGLPYSQAKSDHMPMDTVEGANLALELGPTIERMMADGRLDAEAMPLTRAIIAAICRDEPLLLEFSRFH